MTSTTNETLFYPLCDYQLLGLASAGKTTWPSNQRLIVPGSCLKLDQGGVIDRGKQRYFSLRVPYPETILPWHVAEMTVTGKNCSFSASPKIPTGYVFIYQRDTLNLSKVTISCTVDGTPRLWDPHLAPLPGEVGADLTLEMSSILDSDPCHCAAKDGFKAQRDLFQNLDGSMKENLDLDVSYKDPSCCLTGSKPCPPAEPIGERRGPFTKAEDRSHTGADCKSGVIEIDGVSNSVTIGN